MRSLTSFLASILFFIPLALCQEEHHHALTEEEVGSVHFSTSCRADLTSSFNRAVALLHSFQYEQAREAFTEVASRDPQCAMAQWGIAMSHYHGMWDNGDLEAGRVAIERAKRIAASNVKTTARETAYIDALAEIYRDDDKGLPVHAQAFEQKMGALQAAYPQDDGASRTTSSTATTILHWPKKAWARLAYTPGLRPLRLTPTTCLRICSRAWAPGTSPSVPTSSRRNWQPRLRVPRRTARLATSGCTPWITWNTPTCKAGA